MSYAQLTYSYPGQSQFQLPSYPEVGGCELSESAQQPTSVCSLPMTYESRLFPSFPRLGLDSSYAGFYSPLSAATGPAEFYSSMHGSCDLKQARGPWSSFAQSPASACYTCDPVTLAGFGPYGDRYGTIDSVARRKNATRETTNTLKAWLYEHRKNPYPSKGEKIMLAIITKMTLTQVSTWFANARRRLKKENRMTWEPRSRGGEGEERDAATPKKSEDSLDDEEAYDGNAQKSPLTVENHYDFKGFPSVKVEASDSVTPNCKPFMSQSFDTQTYSSDDSAVSNTSGSLCSYPKKPSENDKNNPSCSNLSNGFQPMTFENMLLRNSESSDMSLHSERPKIWSLARTATSNSPPSVRRSGYHPFKNECSVERRFEYKPMEFNQQTMIMRNSDERTETPFLSYGKEGSCDDDQHPIRTSVPIYHSQPFKNDSRFTAKIYKPSEYSCAQQQAFDCDAKVVNEDKEIPMTVTTSDDVSPIDVSSDPIPCNSFLASRANELNGVPSHKMQCDGYVMDTYQESKQDALESFKCPANSLSKLSNRSCNYSVNDAALPGDRDKSASIFLHVSQPFYSVQNSDLPPGEFSTQGSSQ